MLLLLTGLAALLAPLYIVYRPPQLLIRYFAHRWPDVLWYVDLPTDPTTGQTPKIIALTIDDTPSTYTREILDLLSADDAHATFFVIGSQAEDVAGAEILKEAVVRGNELGNHAMHDEPSRRLSTDVLIEQIQRVDEIIERAYSNNENRDPSSPSSSVSATRPKYFRPGSGFFSTRLRSIVQELGYTLVLGNVYPHDAQLPFAWLNARHILSKVRPGAIVVCHDRRAWTAPMLKVVLPELRRRGYSVVSVSELLRLAGKVQQGERGAVVKDK